MISQRVSLEYLVYLYGSREVLCTFHFGVAMSSDKHFYLTTSGFCYDFTKDK